MTLWQFSCFSLVNWFSLFALISFHYRFTELYFIIEPYVIILCCVVALHINKPYHTFIFWFFLQTFSYFKILVYWWLKTFHQSLWLIKLMLQTNFIFKELQKYCSDSKLKCFANKTWLLFIKTIFCTHTFAVYKSSFDDEW